MTPEQAKAVCDRALVKARCDSAPNINSVIYAMTLVALEDEEVMEALMMIADPKPSVLRSVPSR